jgi:hypothetical protein
MFPLVLIAIAIIIVLIKPIKDKFYAPTLCFGGGPYKIPCELDEKEEAKRLLKQLDTNGKILIEHLRNNYPNLYLTKNLIHRYHTDSIQERSPLEVDDTSYTINKGEVLSICLRDERGNFHDMSLLMYVYLHEMTHIAEDTEQHSNIFWSSYLFMMDEAIKCGIYQPVNYRKTPVRYCDKININFNTYLDNH